MMDASRAAGRSRCSIIISVGLRGPRSFNVNPNSALSFHDPAQKPVGLVHRNSGGSLGERRSANLLPPRGHAVHGP